MKPICAFCISLLACACLPAVAQAGEAPFVTVDGTPVSQATAEMYADMNKANGVPDSPESRARLREDLIDRTLMFEAASKAGFDKKPEVLREADALQRKILAQAEATRQTLVVRAWLQDTLQKHPITEADLRKTYDAYRARGGNTEFQARHILVKSEAEAYALINLLRQGADFAKLARESSMDGASRNTGGSLGWASPARYAPAFGAALRSLKKGAYTSTPVKTAYGYHVILLEDTRPLSVPAFADLKPMLQKEAEEARLKTLVAELRKKVVIH